MPAIRVVIADDHETVREGLKSILKDSPDIEIVAEAADGQAAIAAAKRLGPDVVIMDVSMPTVNGLAATRTLKQACPRVRVLALTRHTEQGYVHQLLRAGASGYVLKQSRASALPHAIRSVAAGGTFVDPAIAGDLIAELSDRPHPAARAARKRDLTAREIQVLKLVALGYSNKEIALQLELSVKTIETHKAKAMSKLALQSRVEVVQFALVEGWLQEP